MNPRVIPALLAMSLSAPGLTAQTTAQPGDNPATPATPPPQIYGKVADGVYTSPSGLYKVPIPVLPELGGNIMDTLNVVTFEDDFSTHISIGAFPLSRELKWEYETRGAKDFLVYFFTNIVMPDFIARFPGASLEDNGIFLPKYQDGSMIVFTLLPGGSSFVQRVTLGATREPVVAKRGNLCFVKYNTVLVVSTELAERVLERSTYHKTVDEENAILRKRLMDIVGKMQFTPPPEAKN
ncbi:MAG TPA: hypothetical protein VLW52_17260 [Opitutaceae bacterium]|nr:hypothetical protein [Opitutaceae bacterium]